MLTVERIRAGYGGAEVLFDVSLEIRRGEVITLLGKNGMGKTTTVAAIIGWVALRGGSIAVDGWPVGEMPCNRRARLGLGLVPEGRRVFPTLTVRENLVATAAKRQGSTTPWTLGRVYEFFPRLRERADTLARHLSGGEQQMLAIGRALMTNPWLLLLDEATEGLAPLIRQEIWEGIRNLKKEGLAILLIDKNLDEMVDLADRHYVIEKGVIRWSGAGRSIVDDPDVLEWLSV